MSRLIDADKLVWRMGIDSNDRQIFFVTGKDIDEQPTIEATPVAHGRWVSMGVHQGHKCGVCEDYYTDDASNLFYCPRCGAKMTEIEKLDYRRKGLPIGAPWVKTICGHGRSEEK